MAKYYSTSDIEIFWIFPSTIITEYSEYLIYDMSGLIGSIGGSLGLFVGFSFRDFFSNFIGLVIEYFNTGTF